MSRLFNWIKSSSGRLLDPQREGRITHAAHAVERELAQKRSSFDLEQATRNLDLFRDDIPLVAESVYRSLLKRAWRDSSIDSKERRSLEWVAGLLRLAADRAKSIEQDVGREVLDAAIGKALSDGQIEADEIHHLRQIAASMGTDIGALMRRHFSREANGILRGVFAAVMRDGKIVQREWECLLDVTNGIGLERHDLLEAIQSQAQQFLEHTLADAKADGVITDTEKSAIEWLLDHVILSQDIRAYVAGEVARLRELQAIEAGRLPSVRSSQLGLRAGELVHAEAGSTYYRTKQLRNGPRTDAFDGTLTITDTRVLFASSTFGIDLNHRRVLRLDPRRGGFELQASGKGAGVYRIAGDAELVTAIYRAAVQRANQTLVDVGDAGRTRHIPRDVRQRTWQRYGGRCADCGDTQYLEFDHVVPVARGGSNSDANVQLLCRRCNMKKSDAI